VKFTVINLTTLLERAKTGSQILEFSNMGIIRSHNMILFYLTLLDNFFGKGFKFELFWNFYEAL